MTGGRYLLTGASFVVIVAGMKAASSILVPFLLAAFIAIICAPLMLWLQRKKVPAGVAVLIVVTILLVTLSLVVLFVGTSLTDFTSSIPAYQQRLAEQTTNLRGWLAGKGVDVSAEIFRRQFDTGRLMQIVGNMLSSLTGVLANTFMILLTVVFILLEASGLPLKVRKAMGSPDASLGPYREFLESVNRYLVIKTIISLLTGLTVFVWLRILGIDFPLLWGFVAFLLNYVPNIGSIIASVPAILLGLVQYGVGSALLVAAGFFAVNTLFGSIIEPRVMGRGLGLSTLVVFVSLVFWGWVLGPVGMLLSVLLTMIVKIALERRDDTRWIAVLLGSTPTESA
jgi:predicted PurR-regulated permease PerM